MNKNIILYLIVISIGCNNNTTIKNRTIQGSETILHYYNEDFKRVFFIRCLKFGFNNSNEINQVLNQDVSVMNDFPLGLQNYRYIDTLAKSIVLHINEDSIHLNKKYLENLKANADLIGKRTFMFSLNYYVSNELDSIAEARVRNIR